MDATRVKVAQLDEGQLAKVRELEEAMGTYVVALEPQHRLAALTEEQLKTLQEAEKALDVILLAFERE